MSQTFTARAESRLTESSFPRHEDTFIIHVDPVERENPDLPGSKIIGCGFPVLAVSGWVAGKEAFAERVATLLTIAHMGNPASTERVALFMCATHCQGGHSEAGAAAASALGVPFPLTMESLAAKARQEGLDPAVLWPWYSGLLAKRAAGRP